MLREAKRRASRIASGMSFLGSLGAQRAPRSPWLGSQQHLVKQLLIGLDSFACFPRKSTNAGDPSLLALLSFHLSSFGGVDLNLNPRFLWVDGEPPHTVDGRTPAPPSKAWNDDAPVNKEKKCRPPEHLQKDGLASLFHVSGSP